MSLSEQNRALQSQIESESQYSSMLRDENAQLKEENSTMREAHEYIEEEIGKHMAAIEAGEYSPEIVAEILVDIQNKSRSVLGVEIS